MPLLSSGSDTDANTNRFTNRFTNRDNKCNQISAK